MVVCESTGPNDKCQAKMSPSGVRCFSYWMQIAWEILLRSPISLSCSNEALRKGSSSALGGAMERGSKLSRGAEISAQNSSRGGEAMVQVSAQNLGMAEERRNSCHPFKI